MAGPAGSAHVSSGDAAAAGWLTKREPQGIAISWPCMLSPCPLCSYAQGWHSLRSRPPPVTLPWVGEFVVVAPASPATPAGGGTACR